MSDNDRNSGSGAKDSSFQIRGGVQLPPEGYSKNRQPGKVADQVQRAIQSVVGWRTDILGRLKIN